MEKSEKLIDYLIKNSFYTKGEDCVNKEGMKYRHDSYKMKNAHTPYWLREMFADAVEEIKGNRFESLFYHNNFCVSFDRATFKGEKDKRIYMSKLIVYDK